MEDLRRGFRGLSLALLVANWTHRGGPLHGVRWPPLVILSAGFTVTVTGLIVVWSAWWGAIAYWRSAPDGIAIQPPEMLAPTESAAKLVTTS